MALYFPFDPPLFCETGNQDLIKSLYGNFTKILAPGLHDFYTLVFINRYHMGAFQIVLQQYFGSC